MSGLGSNAPYCFIIVGLRFNLWVVVVLGFVVFTEGFGFGFGFCSGALNRSGRHTPQYPPALQYAQYLQFLQAEQNSLPVHLDLVLAFVQQAGSCACTSRGRLAMSANTNRFMGV